MNDEQLRTNLQTVEGDGPSTDFVNALRIRVDGSSHLGAVDQPDGSNHHGDGGDSVGAADGVTVVDVGDGTDGRHPWFRPSLLAVAAAVVLVAMVVPLVGRDTTPPIQTAGGTEAEEVGGIWLRSIVENDRETFLALHAESLEVNDTLMGYSADVGVLTPGRVAELYAGGFDALQASLVIDGDFIRPGGCEDDGVSRVSCSYTASLIGTDEYTYTVRADMTVEDRLITAIRFTTSTQPEDLRSMVDPFFSQFANDEDRACMTLGFNTIGCGEHDSDFLRRYVRFYEEQQDQTG